jgi:hypothetical protein
MCAGCDVLTAFSKQQLGSSSWAQDSSCVTLLQAEL